MIGFCESCDGLMSDSGLFPIDDRVTWARQQYSRRGQNFCVPKIDHNPIGPICTDCSNAVKQWEKEEH